MDNSSSLSAMTGYVYCVLFKEDSEVKEIDSVTSIRRASTKKH